MIMITPLGQYLKKKDEKRESEVNTKPEPKLEPEQEPELTAITFE